MKGKTSSSLENAGEQAASVHEKLRSKHIQLLQKLQQVTDENEVLKKVTKQLQSSSNAINNDDFPNEAGELQSVNASSETHLHSTSEFAKLNQEKLDLEKDCKIWKGKCNSLDSEVMRLKEQLQVQIAISGANLDYKKKDESQKAQLTMLNESVTLLKASELKQAEHITSLEKVLQYDSMLSDTFTVSSKRVIQISSIAGFGDHSDCF